MIRESGLTIIGLELELEYVAARCGWHLLAPRLGAFLLLLAGSVWTSGLLAL